MLVGVDDSARLVRLLRQRGSLFHLKTLFMILLGLPASLLGPAVVATLFWVAAMPLGLWVEWTTAFGWASLIMLPALYMLEIRTKGNFLAERVDEITPLPPIARGIFTLGEFGAIAALASNPRTTSTLFTEVFLFGPRLVVDAFRQLRLRMYARGADIRRAASILSTLTELHDGLPTEDLLRANESARTLAPTLAYLAFHDWIGVGNSGGKVWLLTEARRVLER